MKLLKPPTTLPGATLLPTIKLYKLDNFGSAFIVMVLFALLNDTASPANLTVSLLVVAENCKVPALFAIFLKIFWLEPLSVFDSVMAELPD